LEDEHGHALMPPRHLLSLRDLNRTTLLAPMIDAGISSFKIEGRLKDVGYVKNIVAHYRRALDAIIDANPDRYRRASLGRVELGFTPDPSLSFNRGFTTYFSTDRRPQSARMASLLTPKWTGVKIGTVESSSGTRITCRLTHPVNNGDGLAFFTPQSTLEGFNVNTGARPPKGVITTQRPLNIPAGTPIYRNFDKLTAERLQRDDTARRLIDINLTLRPTPFGIVLHAHTTDASLSVSATAVTHIEKARTPQADVRRDLLSRTGGTNYNVASVTDHLDTDDFVPKSVLTSLRRDLVAALDHAIAATHRYGYRRPESPNTEAPARLTYHDNVANHLARKLYTDHGAKEIQPAIELRDSVSEGTRIMTTRYCLRRELGACLRTPSGSRLPQPLFIRSGPIRLALNFDCKNCEMHVIK
ncbi:MAG: U32 family peptidase, partial [Paramuribaculum sp.]|nr:U32 family peptidase [Paramuribaculum sp.]